MARKLFRWGPEVHGARLHPAQLRAQAETIVTAAREGGGEDAVRRYALGGWPEQDCDSPELRAAIQVAALRAAVPDDVVDFWLPDFGARGMTRDAAELIAKRCELRQIQEKERGIHTPWREILAKETAA